MFEILLFLLMFLPYLMWGVSSLIDVIRNMEEYGDAFELAVDLQRSTIIWFGITVVMLASIGIVSMTVWAISL